MWLNGTWVDNVEVKVTGDAYCGLVDFGDNKTNRNFTVVEIVPFITGCEVSTITSLKFSNAQGYTLLSNTPSVTCVTQDGNKYEAFDVPRKLLGNAYQVIEATYTQEGITVTLGKQLHLETNEEFFTRVNKSLGYKEKCNPDISEKQLDALANLYGYKRCYVKDTGMRPETDAEFRLRLRNKFVKEHYEDSFSSNFTLDRIGVVTGEDLNALADVYGLKRMLVKEQPTQTIIDTWEEGRAQLRDKKVGEIVYVGNKHFYKEDFIALCKGVLENEGL